MESSIDSFNAISILRLASSGIGNIFLKIIGTNTRVMIALKIKMPDISDDIVFNCSAILADAITNDNVEVSKNRCYRCLIIKPTSNKENWN